MQTLSYRIVGGSGSILTSPGPVPTLSVVTPAVGQELIFASPAPTLNATVFSEDGAAHLEMETRSILNVFYYDS